MNNLVLNTTYAAETTTTDTCLAYLAKYGEPRLGQYDRGWHCSVNFFAPGKGVKFEIASDFGQATPLDASRQCVDRLLETLSSLRSLS